MKGLIPIYFPYPTIWKKTSLAVIFTFLFLCSFGQDTTYKTMQEILVRGTIRPKAGVHVEEKAGSYYDPKTGRRLGQFRLIFAVDTLTHQLLNVVTVEKSKKEIVTIYYFNQGLVAQVATAVKRGTLTDINHIFTYTEEDNQLEDRTLKRFSEGSEKYALLKAARGYRLAFEKEQQQKEQQ